MDAIDAMDIAICPGTKKHPKLEKQPLFYNLFLQHLLYMMSTNMSLPCLF